MDDGYDVRLLDSFQQQDADLVDAQQRAQHIAQGKQMQVSRYKCPCWTRSVDWAHAHVCSMQRMPPPCFCLDLTFAHIVALHSRILLVFVLRQTCGKCLKT